MKTIGEKLRQTRVKKGLSLLEVEMATKIKALYLEYLEEESWQNFPNLTVGRGMLKNYCEYLGLDSKYILTLFRREAGKQYKSLPMPRNISYPLGYLFPKFSFSSWFLLVGLAIAAVVIFLLYQWRFLLIGPVVILDFPPDNFETFTPIVKISGKTEAENQIFINDQLVNVVGGRFQEEIGLNEGINDLKIKALGKNKKQTSLTRRVIYTKTKDAKPILTK